MKENIERMVDKILEADDEDFDPRSFVRASSWDAELTRLGFQVSKHGIWDRRFSYPDGITAHMVVHEDEQGELSVHASFWRGASWDGRFSATIGINHPDILARACDAMARAQNRDEAATGFRNAITA